MQVVDAPLDRCTSVATDELSHVISSVPTLNKLKVCMERSGISRGLVEHFCRGGMKGGVTTRAGPRVVHKRQHPTKINHVHAQVWKSQTLLHSAPNTKQTGVQGGVAAISGDSSIGSFLRQKKQSSFRSFSVVVPVKDANCCSTGLLDRKSTYSPPLRARQASSPKVRRPQPVPLTTKPPSPPPSSQSDGGGISSFLRQQQLLRRASGYH